MAGDNDDIAALVAQDVDRVIVQGSFVREVKAGNSFQYLEYISSPSGPRFFRVSQRSSTSSGGLIISISESGISPPI
jgi:hypothetical protein